MIFITSRVRAIRCVPSARVAVLGLLWVLAGCASPPGMQQPAPVDAAEVKRAADLYKKYAADFQSVDGVLSVFLSSQSNPREIVVTTSQESVAEALRSKYGREVEGLRVRYETIENADRDKDRLTAVRVVPSTWWGRVLDFWQNWRGYIFPEPDWSAAPAK